MRGGHEDVQGADGSFSSLTNARRHVDSVLACSVYSRRDKRPAALSRLRRTPSMRRPIDAARPARFALLGLLLDGPATATTCFATLPRALLWAPPCTWGPVTSTRCWRGWSAMG